MLFELEPNEKIILKVRRHWLIFLFHGFFIVVLAVLPPGLIKIGSKLFGELGEVLTVPGLLPLLFFIFFLWLLGLWVTLFVKWTDYHLDLWYITPKRIIDVEQKGLFSREVIELKLEKIQDITVEVKGLIPTLFHFGDIHIQTAGAGREIILKDAHNPAYAKKVILQENSRAFDKISKEEYQP